MKINMWMKLLNKTKNNHKFKTNKLRKQIICQQIKTIIKITHTLIINHQKKLRIQIQKIKMMIMMIGKQIDEKI